MPYHHQWQKNDKRGNSGKGKMSKSEQYLRSPKKNFTTENFFGVSDAEFCADFSDTTHWAETGSKKKRTQKNCPKWPKMG